MKKLLALLLAVCVVMGCEPVLAAAPDAVESGSSRVPPNTTAIRQLNTSVYVLGFEGDVFVLNLNEKGKYARALVSPGNGEVLYHFRDRVRLVGYCDGYVYCGLWEKNAEHWSLVCLDLRSMEARPLSCEYPVEPNLASLYPVPDQVWIPLYYRSGDNDGYRYAVVSGDQVIRYETEAAALQIGAYRYRMAMPDPFFRGTNKYDTEEVRVISGDKQEQVLDLRFLDGSTPVGVYEVGGRCVIYCDQGPYVLFTVDPEGRPEELFSFECIHSETAMTIHDSLIFLSVKRYEQFGHSGYGYRRFENDEVEGTYVFDMTDLSVRKISDSIFSGLFNVDDTCLYACDEDGTIFRMSFDGTCERFFSLTK